MKKIIYSVTEICLMSSGDDFDLYQTFDLEDARKHLTSEADWGYKFNHKDPKKVDYVILGYEIDTDEIDEACDYDVNDAKSLFCAYILSVCCATHFFCEKYILNSGESVYDD